MFKRSFAFDGFIEFASQNELGINVTPVARITFTTAAGFSDRAIALYNDGTFDESETICPRQMLRFNPPPSVTYCDKEAYREISTLSQYAANIRFSNVLIVTLIPNVYVNIIFAASKHRCPYGFKEWPTASNTSFPPLQTTWKSQWITPMS